MLTFTTSFAVLCCFVTIVTDPALKPGRKNIREYVDERWPHFITGFVFYFALGFYVFIFLKIVQWVIT